MKLKSIELKEIVDGLETGVFKFTSNKGKESDFDGDIGKSFSDLMSELLKIPVKATKLVSLDKLLIIKTKCGKTYYAVPESNKGGKDGE